MEETLAQISEALGSIQYPEASAPASQAPSDAHQQPTYAPSDRSALLRRLQTFRPSTWFGKPPPLSAVACAVRGWRNVSADLLSCEFCGAKILCHLPAVPQAESAASAIAQYSALLTNSHDDSCPWKHTACDPTLLACPPAPEERLKAAFEARVAALWQLDMVPRVDAAAVAALAAAAAAVSSSSAAAAAAAAAAEAEAGADRAEGSWAVDALASLLGLPTQQLLSHVQKSPAADGPSETSQQDLSEQQQVLLLALCGWDISTLPQHSSGGSKAKLHTSAFALAHLVQSAPAAAAGSISSGADRISSSEAMLRCNECGAIAGLWTLNCVGPLYLKALQASAARARALDATLAAHRASPRVTAAGVPVTPGSSAAEVAPVQSLYQTIAGGDLVAAPKLPKRRFGSESGDSVFGLGAFEVEAKQRRSEGSFGGSEFGDSRAASEARSDVVSPAPSPGPVMTAASPAGDAGAANGGSDGTAAGGAAANGSTTDVGRRASTPSLPPLRQPSLLSPGSLAAAQADRPLLDAVQQHRPWCPWVHAHAGPTTTSSTAAAGAAGIAAAADAEPAKGWLHCLRALAAQGNSSAGSLQLGPVGGTSGADGEAAGVEGVGGSMEDYSAKVRSALGAMWGGE